MTSKLGATVTALIDDEIRAAALHLTRELNDWRDAGGPTEAVVIAVMKLATAIAHPSRRSSGA